MDALQLAQQRLKATGVLDLMEDTIAYVWSANVGRYEPSEIGDTPRSIGLTASENLRELVMRACIDDPSYVNRDVHASAPDQSLVLQVGDLALRALKAPPSSERIPSWGSFNWSTESNTRQLAAGRNHGVLASDRRRYGQELFDFAIPGMDDATRLRDVFLIWSGELEAGLTSGWLGFPDQGGDFPWFALHSVWWHTKTQVNERTKQRRVQADGPGYDQRQQPEPRLQLRDQTHRGRNEEGQK